MNQLEKTLTSLEVAEMVGKRHDHTLRDIERVISQIGDPKVGESYFIESFYIDSQNKQQPSFNLTKKGCELYSTRMSGEKGTQFAVAYIERFNDMEQELNKPKTQAEMMLMYAEQFVNQEKRINVIEQKQDDIKDIISINNKSDWRKEANGIINRIAGNNGGTYKQTREESYMRLSTRARCDLERRLLNKKRRASEAGANRKTLSNLNKLDVIADDARLIEIYLIVIKEMAIENK